MKKVLIMIFLLVLLMMLVACDSSQNQDETLVDQDEATDELNDENMVGGVLFERVDIEDLSEDLQSQVQTDHAQQGYQVVEAEDGYYLVVYAGERPTGGYTIAVMKIINKDEVTEVIVSETSPAEDAMVTQALTYPIDIVRLESNPNETIELVFTETQSNEEVSVNEESDSAVSVQGEYVGQIDNHSIEVLVQGASMAFQLTDENKDQASSYQSGETIGFDYYENGEGQNVIIGFANVQKEMTVTFEGQMDPHSIEVIMDGNPVAFQLSGDALDQVNDFDTGDIVKIIYTENEYGQLVASELIKIEK